MAWFGGGALSAGGAGVAGGAAVLGGILVAPALLIGGIALSCEGEKAQTRAAEHEAEVKIAINTMDTYIGLLSRLVRRTDELEAVLDAMNRRVRRSLATLVAVNFDPEQHAEAFQESALLMRALVEILDTPLLDQDGDVSEASLLIMERYPS